MPKFAIFSFVWNFDILFYEMNYFQHEKFKKDIERHISPPYRSKFTIWDHCQMSVNWKSHYLRIQGKRFFLKY